MRRYTQALQRVVMPTVVIRSEQDGEMRACVPTSLANEAPHSLTLLGRSLSALPGWCPKDRHDVQWQLCRPSIRACLPCLVSLTSSSSLQHQRYHGHQKYQLEDEIDPRVRSVPARELLAVK